MPDSNLDVLGLAVGTVGLPAAFYSCLQIWDLAKAGLEQESRFDRFYCLLGVQYYRFYEWGHYWGLATNHERPHAKLQDRYVRTLLDSLIRNVATELGRAGSVVGENASINPYRHTFESFKYPPKGFHGPQRRIKWALSSDAQISGLLRNLDTLLDSISHLLPLPHTELQELRVQQRELNRTNQIETLHSIEAALSGTRYDTLSKSAAMRRVYLESPHFATATRAPSNLMSQPPNPNLPRGRNPVLLQLPGNEADTKYVEWKYYDKSHLEEHGYADLLRRNILMLANCLSFRSKPAGLHTLDCESYFDDSEALLGPRFGFVFRLPPEVDPAPGFRSLYDLLGGNKIPLGERFKLAQTVANITYHLFVTGWHHKSIRSRNLILFQKRNSPGSLGPFLVGFEYARPSGEGEISLEKPEYEQQNELYRHPEYSDAEKRRRVNYRHIYDIYSLGIVLLEIALWCPLSTPRQVHQLETGQRQLDQSDTGDSQQDEFQYDVLQEIIRRKIVPQLSGSVGNIYRSAVEKCLDGDFGIPEEDNDDSFKLCKAFDERVICVLESCVA